MSDDLATTATIYF